MEKRNLRITVPVTEKEHKIIEELAQENFQTISDFIRQLCLKYKKLKEKNK